MSAGAKSQLWVGGFQGGANAVQAMVAMDVRQLEESDEQRREVGRRIKALRERRGWTQAQLADVVGMHTITISKHERGTSGFLAVHALKYADAFGVTVEALLSGFEVDGLASAVRSEPIYVLHQDAITEIGKAKRIADVRKFYHAGLVYGAEVDVLDQIVSKRVFDQTGRAIQTKVRELGGIPEDW